MYVPARGRQGGGGLVLFRLEEKGHGVCATVGGQFSLIVAIAPAGDVSQERERYSRPDSTTGAGSVQT
jgi:hypothetical protein